MFNQISIGVDVGGTNTDAVLMQGERIIAKCKTATTGDITTGIVKAISALFDKNQSLIEQVKGVNIGTTHLLNALLQRKDLSRPFVVRIGSPATTALPPAIDWEEGLKDKLLGDDIYIVQGGYEFNGSEISSLDYETLHQLAQRAADKKTSSVAITGVFSNLNSFQENEASSIFKKFNPTIEVSLSHAMGNMGLLARENATILNACLADQHLKMGQAFKKAIAQIGLKANIFLTSGDGTKKNLENEWATPLLTLNSGPINSIKGAAFLAQLQEAVTVDIGGTTSDVGLLKGGEPINESSHFKVGGINCNFTSARLNSFALGGGTRIEIEKNATIHLRAESIGKDLAEEALAYGGNTLTPTDIAIALGRIHIGTLSISQLKQKISTFLPNENRDSLIEKIDQAMHLKLVKGIIETLDAEEVNYSHLILVGGGARLFDLIKLNNLMDQRFKSIIIPESADVANALGAALSSIGAKFVQVYDYAVTPRSKALQEATEKAKQMAIQQGADPKTLTCSMINEIPLNYLPGDPNQLTVNIVGKDNGKGCEAVDKSTPQFSSASSSLSNTSVKRMTTKQRLELEKPKENRLNLEGLEILTSTDIDDIAQGAGILGSGGGGNPEHTRHMVRQAIKNGAKVQKISFKNLPDEALTVGFGVMGSPNVGSEKLVSIEEGLKAVQEIEKKMGKNIDAIVIVEGGGSNAVYPLFIAATLGIPVVDADCMGRAFPGINMVTPNIYGEWKELTAVLSNACRSELIQADSFSNLEDQARKVMIEMGGTVTIAFLPMTGFQVKKLTIEGTLSIAQIMGKALRESKGQTFGNRLEALSKVLANTSYQKAEKIYEGKITAFRRKEAEGFSFGGFKVENPEIKYKIEIGFQNENLVVRNWESKQILAQVPDLITIVDKNNFQPICCEDLRYGQEVVVLKMQSPAMMSTDKALKVVGPQAYPMKLILNLLNS